MHLLDAPQIPTLDWLQQHGLPAYRGRQIRRWLFQSRRETFAQMTDLPAEVRQQLEADFQIWTTRVVAHAGGEDGTEKLLLELSDGQRIECVLLRDGQRRTICVSSQVGCGMGCVFCASGLDGVVRNLTAGEMVEQMLRLMRLLPAEQRISHLVMMGMGEPLANLNQVLPALAVAESAEGLGLSARRITISTVGLPAAIRKLAAARCRYNLAVSLHAADDTLRDQLVPVNRQIGLAPIMAAADEYFARSGRRLTFEYVLLAGVNDRPEDARRLAGWLRGRPALLNLIPYNPVAGLAYRTPSSTARQRFTHILQRAGVNVKVRHRKGSRIDAACGQLRRIRGPQAVAV
ncbi:MAG: 23S rRNA (adenine(2503)-C(2))-methyltransferase RlmN [Planctomycetales bacterium]|nr:23S rRNA (adenine(2503)-C(2))-methyltransferase RlmN [Planctomycetales bacterium]